jgi:predicted RNase H-like HicB family nuclease
MKTVKLFTLSRYVESAIRQAEYERDENGVIIAQVPAASGFFAQGDTFEEARENLRDVIEGNILLALQLGLEIPDIVGVDIREQNNEYNSCRGSCPHPGAWRLEIHPPQEHSSVCRASVDCL